MSISGQIGLDLAHFVIDVIGTYGPVSFYTQIATLQPTYYGYDLQQDLFILGKDGEEITDHDIRDFLKAIEKYANEEKFDNATYYCFQGIEKTGDREYTVQWQH